jgi:hypothetical protein
VLESPDRLGLERNPATAGRGVDKLGLDCGHVFRPPRNADVVSNGSYIGRLGGFPGNFASAEITIGNVSAPLQGAFGTFTPTIGGFTSEVGTKGPGVSFTILDYSSTFDFTQNSLVADGNLRLTDGGAIRTLDFNVSSETFAVSAVPLPPALPLFAAALLALGIFGYVRRAKDVTAVQT